MKVSVSMDVKAEVHIHVHPQTKPQDDLEFNARLNQLAAGLEALGKPSPTATSK